MESNRIYHLEVGVQVRREKFGLLFYNYQGPRLYFLACGGLLDEGLFEGKTRLDVWAETLQARTHWPQEWIEQQLTHSLGLLEEKGLVHGESVC
jgi:putative mycofactocin binding protein MftB